MGNKEYRAPIAIPPGESLQDILDYEGMSQKELADRIGITTKHLSHIITGKASITEETAIKLEYVFPNTPAKVWLGLEANYRETLTRLERQRLAEEEKTLLDKFPYAELVEMKRLENTKDKLKKIENMKRFLGVSELKNIEEVYELPAAARMVNPKEVNKYALATWIRVGEIDANKSHVKSVDIKLLKSKLPYIRSFTRLDINEAVQKLKEVLSECGVAFVLTKSFKGTYVNGVTKWMKDRILVQLNFRNKWIDIFWFSLFHELGHVILHGKKELYVNNTDSEDDKGIYIDYEDIKNDLPKEKEADEFARNNLIPEEEYTKFINSFEFIEPHKIIQFAEKIGISPCIVVGRLMKDKYIAYNSKVHVAMRPRCEIVYK